VGGEEEARRPQRYTLATPLGTRPRRELAALRRRARSSASEDGGNREGVPGALLGKRTPRRERRAGDRWTGEKRLWIWRDSSLRSGREKRGKLVSFQS